MAITLTIADAEDGTGGTATISGTAVGSTNTLYRAHFQGLDGVPLAWETVGSRSGDGTIAASTPVRNYYLWYVKNVDGSTTTVSQIVLQALTDKTYTSVRTRALQAVVDRAKLLDLEEIGSRKVLLLAHEDEIAVEYPALLVLRDVVPDTYLGGTNIRDDVGIPIQLILQDKAALGANMPVAKWDLWWEKINRGFRNQRLPGVNEVYNCTIEPGRGALDPKTNEVKKIYAGAVAVLTIRAVSREVRGIQA